MKIENILPFGKKKKIEISEKTGSLISKMMIEFPDFWEAIEDLIYTQMNVYSRDLILKDKNDRDRIADDIKCLDRLLKTFLSIKRTKYDEVVEKSGYLPVLKPNMVVKKEPKRGIMDYIKSRDIRDKNGKIKLTSSN